MRARTAAVTCLISALVLLTGCADDGRVPAPGTPGVTAAPCPKPVNEGNGCIYLGTLTDLTGPFSPLTTLATKAQEAFWQRVNTQGGIGGYDIDVTTYVRDTGYNVAAHERMFTETKDSVLAYAQMLGSQHTLRVLPTMENEQIVTTPMSWTSQWAFSANVIESGGNYCFEAMNLVDYAAEYFPLEDKPFKIKSVVSVHYEGEYGADAAAGARLAAKRNGFEFSDLSVKTGGGETAVQRVLKGKPNLIQLSMAPADASAFITGAVQAGYKGRFLGSTTNWHHAMAALPGAQEQYWQGGAWWPFAADSPGHAAMRRAVGDVTPDDAYVSGWTFSYPLLEALRDTVASGPLTRQRLLQAVRDLRSVDYEGILPVEAGDATRPYRGTVVSRVDPGQYTGVRVVSDFYVGETAKEHVLTSACYHAAG
ncbi:ABC-type branched-subunit amino acid transport system substrate-binding protein [Actinocorallia herbida]|uniref:ABC-type branched-subunit amino acid transport system substrate-binding protein n=1 Tax=Actinocorallia herbida TaxID=58109 RepID=A0A3N1D7U3_9ACTN|nr:ABC transporter substrate-binding protein [Actinocorallia herbida]ROO89607.1 ABC-type branched-subunit amino acid transport system substrate-binding protein [Actinocorallia herbida]